MNNERCDDCLYHSEITNRVEKAEDQIQNILQDISEIKGNTGRNDEQIKMIFNILNEIKDSIKNISDKIDILEKAPGRKWDDLVKTVITVVATAAVTYFISH